jgi:hypothetical protein
MTEISVFPNGSDALLMDDNHAEPMTDVITTAHVVPERGVFITSRGNEIELSGQSISSLMLERITNAGKPKIPRKEVLLLGKHKEVQANANDPDYLALLAEWDAERNVNIMRYVFVIGVKGQPPQEFVDIQKQFFEGATDLDIKYLWVTSRLPDEDINILLDVLLGRNLATAKGLEEAANFSTSALTDTP